jgi:hypothetical protein
MDTDAAMVMDTAAVTDTGAAAMATVEVDMPMAAVEPMVATDTLAGVLDTAA